MSNEYNDWKRDCLYEGAFNFAHQKHINQKRKWNNEPYINHPIRVQQIMFEHMNTSELYNAFDMWEELTISMTCLLHDTLEDTDTTYDELVDKFDSNVADLVNWLTNVSKLSDGNRKVRKQKDMEHILKAPIQAICIKLADVIDNCKDIVENEQEYNKYVSENDKSTFAKKYLNEKKEFLNHLDKKYKEELVPYLESLDISSVERYHNIKWLRVFETLFVECEKIIEKNLKKVLDI